MVAIDYHGRRNDFFLAFYRGVEVDGCQRWYNYDPFSSPPLFFPLIHVPLLPCHFIPSTSFRSEAGPLNAARGSGEAL